MSDVVVPDEEEASDLKDPKELARYWSLQIELGKNHLKDFIQDGRKVVDLYRQGQKEAKRSKTTRRFNILYSNTEVLRSSLYGKDPKPDVRRKYNDPNPVNRDAAEIVERILTYSQEEDDPGPAYEASIQDYLLVGRGVIRVEYTPTIGPVEPAMLGHNGGPPLNDNAPPQVPDGEDPDQPEAEQEIKDQKVCEKYVFWEDFIHPPTRSWEQMPWVAFRHMFTRSELKSQIFSAPETSETYGSAQDVPLNWTPDLGRSRQDVPDSLKKAEVFEIWNKEDKRRYWVVPGYVTILRADEDPYGLRDFWPLPEPIASYQTTDDIVPEPEYHAYRDQAADLDELTARISRLTRALKRRGVYDKSMPDLKKLAIAGDNDFIGIDNWGSLSEKGGLAKVFETEDISVIAAVLEQLYRQRDQLIQGIYQLTGIADIMRGATSPEETATAQQIKTQFGSLRLKRRQRSIQKWVRTALRIKGQLIAEHFEPKVLEAIAQMQITPEIMAVLRSDQLRGFSINIETDSTVLEDAEAEQQQRIALLTAMATFLRSAVPGIQMMPELTPLIIKMLDFGVRSFKPGREFEDMLEQFMKNSDGIVQQLQQQKQAEAAQNSPAAKIQVEQQRAQIEGQKAQAEGQTHMAVAQAKIGEIHAKTQATIQGGQQKLALAQIAAEDKRVQTQQNFQQKSAQDQHAHQQDLQMAQNRNEIEAASGGQTDALNQKVDALTQQMGQLTQLLTSALQGAQPQPGPPAAPPMVQ